MPKKAAAAPVEEAPATEKDFTAYATKAPTSLQSRFADWLIDEVGLEFGTKKEEAAFKEGVRLGTALRIPFQRSDANQEYRQRAAMDRGSDDPLADPPAKAAKKAAAPAKKAAKKAAPAETAEPEAAAQAPAKSARPRKAARSGVAAPF